MGNGGGLAKYSPKHNNFTYYGVNPRSDSTNIRKSVSALYEDKFGIFWIGTSHGLYQFNIQKETFKRIDKQPESFTPSNPIPFISIYEDLDRTMFFGTPNGILTYDRENKKLLPFKPFYNSDFHIPKLDIKENPISMDHKLWITAWNLYVFDKHTSLYVFDKNTSIISQIIPDSKDPSSIRGNMLKSLFIDESGILWIPGEFGVNILDPVLNQIKGHPEFGKKYGDAMSFCEDNKGNTWIGTSKLLVRLDKDMNVVAKYDSFPLENSNNDFMGDVWSVFEDSDHNIWIGTEFDGLFVKEYGKTDYKSCNFSDTKKNIPVYVWKVFEDSQGTIWIATSPYGLYQRKRGERPITYFYNDSLKMAIDISKARDIYEDRSGSLWISTSGSGLFLQLPEYQGTYNLINFRHDPKNIQSISSDWIWAVYEDENNNVWIATENGLNKFIKGSNIFEKHITSIDPSANVIYNLVSDNQGYLWMTTQYGLIRYKPWDLDKWNISKNTIKQILPSNDILCYTIFKNKNGKIFLGGEYNSGKGFYCFHPDSLKVNQRIPPVAIVDFKVNNEQFGLDSSISHKRHIKLKNNQNFISFEFAALDYTEPSQNQYAYKLEGLDKDWVYSANRSYANYTSIPPGKYIFHVKGSNNDGYWNETGTSISIIISPPPWKTLWAYMIYAISFCLTPALTNSIID